MGKHLVLPSLDSLRSFGGQSSFNPPSPQLNSNQNESRKNPAAAWAAFEEGGRGWGGDGGIMKDAVRMDVEGAGSHPSVIPPPLQNQLKSDLNPPTTERQCLGCF